jgi:hypothetical protein
MPGSSNSRERVAFEAGAAVLMTITAFKLVPNILGRIVLGGVVVVAMIWAGLLPADPGATRGVWGQRTAT